MEDSVNKIMAGLLFDIGGIKGQMEQVEAMVNKTAMTSKEAFAQSQLTMPPMDANQILAQEAKLQSQLMQEQAKGLSKREDTRLTVLKESSAREQAILAEGATKRILAEQKANAEILALREKTYAQIALLEQQRIAAEARTAAYDNNTGGMGDLIFRHAGWLLAGGAVFGTLELLKQGIVDVEKGMKGLQTVLPELAHDQEAYNEASRETIDLMQKLGSDLDDTMTSARSFGRMYKDVETVMGLTNDAILLNVIDQVSLEDAVKGNEVALSTYGDTLKSTNEVLAFSGKLMDSITILSHNTLATGTDLVNILQQTSSAAKQAGTDLDQLLGLGAASIRATGLQGQGGNIGRALRTVFTQLSAPSDDVEKTIEGIGVQMRDTNGELRSAYDIILDLSLATQDATLSQEELNDAMLKAASGKFQYNKLAALVGQFDDIVKNTAMSINSQGQTLEMAGQQLDTISRKAGQLKATLIDMFSGAGDSGLRETIKGLIDVLNQFLMGLNKVSPAVINTGLALGGLMLAGKLVVGIYGSMSKVIGIATTAMGINAAAAGTEAVALEGVAVAEGTAAAGATELATATAIASGGLTVLLGALALYTFHMGEAEKAQLSLKQAAEDDMIVAQQEMNQHEQEISFLESMKQKREQLEQKIKSGTLSAEELAATNKDLTAVEESVGLVVDDEVRKRMESIGVKNSEINKIIDLINTRKQEVADQYQNQIAMSENAIKGAESRMKAYEAEMGTLMVLENRHTKQWNSSNFLEKVGMSLGDYANVAMGGKNNVEYRNQRLTYLREQNDELEKTINKEKELLGEARNNLVNYAMAGPGAGGIDHTAGSSSGKDKVEAYTEAFKQYIQELEEGLPAVDDVLADHTNALDLLGTKQAIWKNQIDGLVPTLAQQNEEYGYLTQTIEQYKASQEDLHTTADQYRAQMANVTTLIAQEDSKLAAGTITKKQHRESVQLLQNEYDKLDKTVDSMGSQWMKDQQSIIQTQQEYDNLDDTIAKLKFDELKQKFDNNLISAEQYRTGIEGLEKEFTSLGSAMANTLQQAEFSTILSSWNTAINDALDEAQKKFDKAMDNIDEDVEDAKQGLTDFKDAVSGIFDDVNTSDTINFSDNILQKISEYLPAMLNAPAETFGAIENALYPVSENLNSTLANIGTTMSNIVDGVYKATDSELDVSKETFLDDLEENVNGLNDASNQINTALNDVDTWKNSEIRRIDSEIETIKNKLESDVKTITGLFDELDAAESKYSRDTARNNWLESYNAAMGIATTSSVSPTTANLAALAAGLPGQLDLSNLGNLSAEQFANTIKQGLTTLEDAKIKAEGYISDLADSTKQQVAAIDNELKKLDEETKADTRADAEEEHNRKIKELQEKLAYEQVRTGQEHVDNIKDINKQIEEENRSWAETQEDYVREDKKTELEEKKTTLQKNTDLMNQALSDFVAYINSEIQTRKTATEDFKTQLTEKANADTAELEVERNNLEERAKLLTTMLTGMQQYVTDEIAAWQELADKRTDIFESEVNEYIKSQNSLKESMTDLWNDKKTGIVAITKNGVLATLAMMAAMSDGFKTQGMAMVQGLIDGITDKDLKDTLTTELQNILNATVGGVPTTTTTTTPKTTYTDTSGKTVTTDIGSYNDSGKLVISSSTPFTSGSYAISNGDGTYTVYTPKGSTYIVDSSGENATAKHNAHLKAESDYAQLDAMGYKQGAADIRSKKTYQEALDWYNQYIKDRTDLKSGAKELFADIVAQKKTYEGLALGGIVAGGNPVLKMLGDAPYDEAVIPLPQIQPMIDEAILASLTKRVHVSPDLSKINALISEIDRLQVQINVNAAKQKEYDMKALAREIVAAMKEGGAGTTIGNAVNIENYTPVDNTDVQIISREIMREVLQFSGR